jgi:hypothetical protein
VSDAEDPPLWIENRFGSIEGLKGLHKCILEDLLSIDDRAAGQEAD